MGAQQPQNTPPPPSPAQPSTPPSPKGFDKRILFMGLVAIILIIAAVSIPLLTSMMNNSQPAESTIRPTSKMLNNEPNNPEFNNTRRKSDLAAIAFGLTSYVADKKVLPSQITTTQQPLAKNGADLCHILSPDYLNGLPQDPSKRTPSDSEEFANVEEPVKDCDSMYDTGYTIFKDAQNNVTISAPLAENGEIISETKTFKQ